MCLESSTLTENEASLNRISSLNESKVMRSKSQENTLRLLDFTSLVPLLCLVWRRKLFTSCVLVDAWPVVATRHRQVNEVGSDGSMDSFAHSTWKGLQKCCECCAAFSKLFATASMPASRPREHFIAPDEVV